MNYLKDYLYTKTDVEAQRFFQMPKLLYENNFYKDLSNGAKIVYMVTRDRQDLSIANDWHDKKGYVFSYFDDAKLADKINVSRSSVSRFKKELEKKFLIVQVRQGQGRPNRWYILKPTDVDFTLMHHFDTFRSFKKQHLELSKYITNETDSIETDLRRLNIYIDSGEINARFLSFYLYAYMDNYGKEHPRVSVEKIGSVLSDLTDVSDSLSYEEYCDMVIEYFEQLPKSNNGNILSFVTAKDRYLLNGEW